MVVLDLIDKILQVFKKHGLFDEGVELIGSWSFLFYQKHLGAPQFPLRTQDIDFLIPNPFKGKEHYGFIEELMVLGFQKGFRRDGSVYLYSAELLIEFITPEKGKGVEEAIPIKKLGLKAIPLRFVSLLLDNPRSIKENGMEVLVPNPLNFCLHKLIIASRRRKPEKAIKDLQQALYTSAIVDKRELVKLFESLPKPWQKSIVNVLNKSIDLLPLEIDYIEPLKITLQIPKK